MGEQIGLYGDRVFDPREFCACDVLWVLLSAKVDGAVPHRRELTCHILIENTLRTL